MDKDDYYDNFLHPGPKFGPANYWFWQRIPTKEEIDRQLAEMVDAGYRIFYIQPRLAFPIEQYLRDEYLSAYRYAIEQAHSLGLQAGIYDDYNWNSGHAGGLTVKGHDEYRERQLFWTSTSIASSSFVLEITDIKTLMGDTLGGPQGYWTYEGGKPIWASWQLVRLVGYPGNTDLQANSKLVDLSQYGSIKRSEGDQCEIAVSLPDNQYSGWKVTAFVSSVCITSRHMNYLNRQATSHFIEVGYEPYKRAVGDFFGTTVFCMFMDHPHAGFYTWKQMEGNIRNSLMYDDSLVDAFKNEHGYPIEIAWLSFLLPESQFTPKSRGDFFDTYGRLARENFLGQVSGWAHENGLQFAGHELFGFLGIWGFYGGYHIVDQRTDFGGDYFGIGRYKDLSTVDAFNSNPQIDAKVGDSIARAHGSHGCMLEQYYFSTDPTVPGAIGHWNLTFDEMRAQALRHTFFGAKQFIFHGFYLSDKEGKYELLASSRFDFAPGINYEPWFVYHSDFAREISRLSAFIYNAQPLTEIGILYPLSTFWVEGTDGVFGDHSGVWNKWLLENGYGFDIVDEDQVVFDQSVPGKIQAGPNSYRILVLPGVTVLRNSKLLADIVEFVRSGGVLLLSGALPGSTVEDGVDPAVRKAFEEMIQKSPTVQYFETEQAIRDSLAAMKGTLLPSKPRIILLEGSGGQLWTWMGQDEAGYLIAMFNDADERKRAMIEIPDNDASIEKWDLNSGEKSEWLWYQDANQSARTLVDIKPRAVVCLRIQCPARKDPAFHLVETPLQVIQAKSDGSTASIRVVGEHPGTYRVKLSGKARQNADAGGDRSAGSDSYDMNLEIPALPAKLKLNRVWKLTIPGKAERTTVKLKSGWEEQGFGDYAGEGVYETVFDMAKASQDWALWSWKLVFPQVSTSAEVIVNGRSVGRLPWPPYELTIPTGTLKPVGNRLLVKVYNTAGNFYYSGSPYQVAKAQSGIIGFPYLQPYKSIEITEKGIHPDKKQ